MSPGTRQALRCPACRSELSESGSHLQCTDAGCGRGFPIVDGIPVLIDESNSLFRIEDFEVGRATTWPERPLISRIAGRVVPDLNLNPLARRNCERFGSLVRRRGGRLRVLVIGGRSVGKGLTGLLASEDIEFVESDVSFGPRTTLICDAHDLPFEDGAFDGVIMQAVVQYLQDPARVADEIHRVLGTDGVVYVESPFVQHGLEGYDYNRYPMLGLRRLFRRFDEIACGAAAGPATALNWSLQFFFLSFVEGRAARAVVKGAARVAFFWIRYFDYYLIHKPASVDAACELFFIGAKSDRTLSDRDLAEAHRKFW